jgi:amino acid transporter
VTATVDETVVLLPSAAYPEPTDRDLAVLREVGRHWQQALGGRRISISELPVDPDLAQRSGRLRSTSRMERFVGGDPGPGGDGTHGFHAAGRGTVVATEEAITPPHHVRLAQLRRVLLGPPLATTAIVQERLSNPVALAVLSSDALSSVAYGTEAMLSVLVLAGSSALGLSLPIGAVIVMLMLIVGASYRQTVRAYPHGGGSYIVAGDNLGRLPGLLAAAGLMTDYVLTVAVSVTAGVAAITSALPPARPYTVALGVAVIAFILAVNLRGIRQSGRVFALPTYAFVAGILLLIVVGLAQAAARGWTALPPPPARAVEGVGMLLVLRAFASGCSAMTGIEAISNGVPVFRPPEWRNARTTLSWMVILLAVMFSGITLLAHLDGTVPGQETVLSQLASHTFGRGVVYGYIQVATALILALAANTAFSDFPRLLYFLARDRFAPRPFLRMGDRLVYSNGIVVLAVVAALLVVAFHGVTDRLIALYAVGVFLAFTLSQLGMTVHWWRGRGERWVRSMLINGLGATLCAVVVAVIAVAKFVDGAWLVVIVVPMLVYGFLRVHAHYDCVEEATAPHPAAGQHRPIPFLPDGNGGGQGGRGEAGYQPPPEHAETPDQVRHLVIVPVAWLDLASLRALAYAVSVGKPVLALHVAPDEDEARRARRVWEAWGNHVPLEIIMSPYRAVVVPVVNYVAALQERHPKLTVSVVFPELVLRRRWHTVLHNHIPLRCRVLLRVRHGVVLTSVPFHPPC